MQDPEILIVEDDPEMAEVLRLGFEQSLHPAVVARDGLEGLRLARQNSFRAIVLDVLLPVLDGFQVARELREQGITTPILMLTARDAVADVVLGLESGAEDYMTKPFSFVELSARIRSLIRRTQQPPRDTRLSAGELTLDTTTHRALRGRHELRLTKTEFRVLEVLMRAEGKVLRRSELVKAVWGSAAWVDDNTLDKTVSGLRSTVDKGFAVSLIRTVRGLGYRLDVP